MNTVSLTAHFESTIIVATKEQQDNIRLFSRNNQNKVKNLLVPPISKNFVKVLHKQFCFLISGPIIKEISYTLSLCYLKIFWMGLLRYEIASLFR